MYIYIATDQSKKGFNLMKKNKFKPNKRQIDFFKDPRCIKVIDWGRRPETNSQCLSCSNMESKNERSCSNEFDNKNW